ncbi:MAG TPA: NAD-glutamate dehydrogenase [Jatrophihabitantaceae bacterium]|jgi:glutamate dehydrogenase|nr:NAD-glutamate dehydrogenase [Jatrophihabitantaceae bacterium]
MVEAADSGVPGDIDGVVDDEVFLRRYLAHAALELPNHDAAGRVRVAHVHRGQGEVRNPGETQVRLRDIDGDTTAIEIVTDDAPYLVDSIQSELKITGHPVENVLHPLLVLSRNESGKITHLYDIDDTSPQPPNSVTEAWIYIEVSRIRSVEFDEIAGNLQRVIGDVHNAVRDAPELQKLFGKLADKLARDPGQFDRVTSQEAGELLRWLADGNFVILGHASFSSNELASAGNQAVEHQVRGVLRGEATVTPREVLPAYRSGAPVVVFKSPLISTVLRSARYDCVTVMEPVNSGTRIHVFLGLFSATGDTTVARVPVVRRRIAEVLRRSGLRANSHTGRMMMAALRTLPRDELLESDIASLLKLATLVVNRAERGGVGVFSRVHLNNDFVSVLVYLPQERLGPESRRHIRDVVAEFWPGRLLSRDDTISELGLARLHFLIALRPGEPVPSPNYRDVEARITQATRGWSDDLADLLMARFGDTEGSRLLRRYERAFPEAYKEDYSTAVAVHDIELLESQPEENGLAFDLCPPLSGEVADRRLKLLRTGRPISLARVLPMLSHLGVEVLDERPYELERSDGPPAWIYDFGLKTPTNTELTRQQVGDLIEVLRRLWVGDVEQDGFNALLLQAGLTWHQVVVLRAYAKYLRQTGSTYSQGYIEQTLSDNPDIVRQLVELFESRFDPTRVAEAGGQDKVGTAAQVAAVVASLDTVASLDQDRILRSLLGLINATVRTSAFQPTENGQPRVEIAFKLDSTRIDVLPNPRPYFEIWVYSPRVEGVHLRFGPVARGGLRWSDRREDFRTEVLGLVKAQSVKNAIIVPVGAKGGFVAKQLPDPNVDRDAWLAEGQACYRTFISCMLDITDNYAHDPNTGEQVVVPPADVVCYDGADPYLVVAADKGTAKFSDIANDIAVQRGFWLGDAFASGGSAGYDHKAMGITARGAWESVKYHFREMGIDTQTQDFTVVGIGDMSGDVFGNGMLLSEHIRLVAAFDHRHIFLDPDPDASGSFAERRRLFDMPRSSWDDYDRSAISEGGGVYPRTLKAIPISAQVAKRLDLPPDTETLPPNDLMHAILIAPVDLLWSGGIGTYVKSASESHADVGDKANDGIRADATELGCRVIGEGGNLGCTQLGRVEFARAGGHVNTDAIDNSAGVDTSDHEVNIKILLDRQVAAGRIDHAERNDLLEAATDEVAQAVLRDNYLQNVLLGIERQLSVPILPVYQRLMTDLESQGWLNREIEFLPSDRSCVQMEDAGLGMASPELAVVAAYVKITLTKQLRHSDLPGDPWFRRALRGYFPSAIVERFDDTLNAHPLAADIMTTCVVNDMVNRAGTTFAYRASEERGADVSQVARAWTVLREVFDLESLWVAIEALDNITPTAGQDAAYFEIRRLIDRGARWLLDVHYPITDLAALIDRYRPPIRALFDQVPHLLRGAEREALYGDVDRLVGLGVPREHALRVGILLSAFLLLDVVDIAEKTHRPPAEIAELHYALSEMFSVDKMLTAVTMLPRDNRWSALARAALRDDVYTALSAITTSVLHTTPAEASVTARTKEWEQTNHERIARTRSIVDDALNRDTVDLATLSVALRVMRGLPGRSVTAS